MASPMRLHQMTATVAVPLPVHRTDVPSASATADEEPARSDGAVGKDSTVLALGAGSLILLDSPEPGDESAAMVELEVVPAGPEDWPAKFPMFMSPDRSRSVLRSRSPRT